MSHLQLVTSVVDVGAQDDEPFFDAVGNVVESPAAAEPGVVQIDPATGAAFHSEAPLERFRVAVQRGVAELEAEPQPALFPTPPPTPLERLRAALEDQPEVVLAGYAGTGKTTLVRQLIGRGVVLCAPTAKAAGRLKEVTGEPATTVHRLIYGAPVSQWVKADGQVCKGYTDDKGIGRKAPGCPGCACTERLVFGLPSEPKEGDRVAVPPHLIVVDEASMVDAQMANDIREAARQLGAKILWVGDPGQLPPVAGGPGVNFKGPDVLLDKVHRADGGILALATRIRSATSFADLRAALDADYPDVEVRRGEGVDSLASWRAKTSRRMAIVHTNKQRVDSNERVRAAIGREGPLVRGDRVIVRKNAQSIPVWNGEVYKIQSVERPDNSGFTIIAGNLDKIPDDAPLIRFVVHERYLAEPDSQEFGRNIYVLREAFQALADTIHHEKCPSRDVIARWDFEDAGECHPECGPGPFANLALVNAQHGFVITCHASQGSEADEVGVLWTPRTHRDDFEAARAWLYTAVTRARKALVIWT